MARAEDKTILVVDDEPDVRLFLKTVLEDAGFQVLTAGDGVEAMDIIERERPDLISLDLIMPRKTGHKLLHELKRDPDLARIPVLIVTAHARDDLGRGAVADLQQSGVMSGPGVYLEKPVKPTTYVRAVQRALGLAETAAPPDKVSLKEELQDLLQEADAESLRKALDALKPK